MKKIRRFVDSRFVKTCDEFVTRQQNFQLRLFDICNMLMEIWMLAHLTNDKKMVYYIKLIVNFLIMSFDFGEINLNLHLHSIQRTIFLSGQGNLLFKGYWQESFIFLNFCNTLSPFSKEPKWFQIAVFFIQNIFQKIFSEWKPYVANIVCKVEKISKRITSSENSNYRRESLLEARARGVARGGTGAELSRNSADQLSLFKPWGAEV